ncbi:MAG TPA: hypothetical protein VMG58_01905 [Candidatus Sulfotelmatobacter sp.]|nr:hypothetical protein [Candidatus Sulfotelmatobacter sp.]
MSPSLAGPAAGFPFFLDKAARDPTPHGDGGHLPWVAEAVVARAVLEAADWRGGSEERHEAGRYF